MAFLPVLLIRKRHIVSKLLKKNAISRDSAVTFKEAGIKNPNGFKRFTLRLVEQGVLHQCGDKYFVDTSKQ